MLTKPWDIYAKHFHGGDLGHPLWIPEPNEFAGGREIFMGDVGYLREGQFIPLFNVMKPTDDPINRRGVPRGFKNLSESRPKLSIHKYRGATQTFQSTGSMKIETGGTGLCSFNPEQADSDSGCPVARWKFKCVAGPGAFMAIDSPITYDNNHSNLWIRSYMREHMDAWLEFVNARLQLCLDEQDLVFVSGTVKASRWAFGASAGEKFCNEEEKLVRESSEDEGLRFAGHRFPVCHSGGGPAGASSDVREQCLFLNYYKMKRRASGGGLAKRESSPCDAKCEVKPAYRSPDEHGYDPAGPLLDYILQNSGAEVAIASEQDVTTLFIDKSIPESGHFLGAIGWLSPLIKVDKHGIGTIDCHLDTPWAWRIACRIVGSTQAVARNLGI